MLDALRTSSLRSLPDDRLEALLLGGHVRFVERGHTIQSEGDHPAPRLLIRGFVRVYRTAPDGRRITARYARSGALLGISYQFSHLPVPDSGGLDALSPSTMFDFDARTIIELAARDLLVANALLAEASDRSISFEHVGAEMTFATMRQRVARHVLDLADVDGDGHLVASITQQELAEAIGSHREVVVRILGDLRDDGFVETDRRFIHVLDVEGLHGETYGRGR